MNDPTRMRDAIQCASFYTSPDVGTDRYEFVYRAIYRAIDVGDPPPTGLAMHLYGTDGKTIRGISLWRSREEFDRHFMMVVSGVVVDMVREMGVSTDARGEASDVQPDTVVVDDVLVGPQATRFVLPGAKDSRALITELEERPVLVELNLPGLTKRQYFAAIARSGLEASMPEGLIAHFAGDSPDGFRIDQVWLSEAEARESIASVLAPALESELGAGAVNTAAGLIVFMLERLGFNRDFGDGLVY